MKTFEECLEAVKPEWAISLNDNTVHDPIYWDKNGRLPTERQAQQIINLKKMMVIAEAVGMDEGIIWMLLEYTSDGIDVSDGDWAEQTIEFIRICQDPDGDGDESKNLFNPFKPDHEL